MNKTYKKLCLIMLCVFAIITVLMTYSFIHSAAAKASTQNNYNHGTIEGANDEAEPYGVLVSLSISINGGNGKVWTKVKNDFTLFPAKIIVILELYSSTYYTDNYQAMTLVAVNSIDDLNIGKTITTEAGTGGVEKYWMGRMRYKVDSKSWKTKATGVCRISGSGEFLGYT